MVAVDSGKVIIAFELRFGVSEARRVRDTVLRLSPVREVVLDFRAAALVEDTALLVLADLMKEARGSRFRLKGLTHHRRRLLRYMGAPEPDPEPGHANAA